MRIEMTHISTDQCNTQGDLFATHICLVLQTHRHHPLCSLVSQIHDYKMNTADMDYKLAMDDLNAIEKYRHHSWGYHVYCCHGGLLQLYLSMINSVNRVFNVTEIYGCKGEEFAFIC